MKRLRERCELQISLGIREAPGTRKERGGIHPLPGLRALHRGAMPWATLTPQCLLFLQWKDWL